MHKPASAVPKVKPRPSAWSPKPSKGTKADPANYLIAMRYLETLQDMTSGQNNKVVYIPYEATGVLSSVGGIKDMLVAGSGPK